MISARSLIANVFESYQSIPLSFSRPAYWEALRTTYERTVADVQRLCVREGRAPASFRVLEIGAFCGIVATALRREGFAVTAFDLPLFMSDPELQRHYSRHAITMASGDLDKLPLEFADGSFDLIICCEVIEHLNFNPLGVFCEFNRLLRPDGVLYLGTPNQANIVKRLRLLRGASIHNPVIPDLVWQLNPMGDFSIGLHWREFTAEELAQLLRLTEFIVLEQYFCHVNDRQQSSALRRALVSAMYRAFPSFLPGQVAIGRKARDCTVASLIATSH